MMSSTGFNIQAKQSFRSSGHSFMLKSSKMDESVPTTAKTDATSALMKKLRESALKKSVTSSTKPSTTSSASQSTPAVSSTTATSSFGQLGLDVNIVGALTDMNFIQPTPVQRAIIPRLLAKESIVMAAATGSGKTLAFLLPVLQTLLQQVSLIVSYLSCG
jgi:Rad3-related DNA helicase